jgi:drug/metabolite transporter (DMT)-like permease
MPTPRLVLLTTLALLAFAGNSLLCRMALQQTAIDPASFTLLRLLSGAGMLWALCGLRGSGRRLGGHWRGALALFVYAAGFSYAYLSLPAGTGALILFGAVQATMLGFGLWRGERLGRRQLCGLALALGGLLGLLLPGASAPALPGALLMLAAGSAWGGYSLLGRGSAQPLLDTAGNFVRALPPALLLSALCLRGASLDPAGVGLALASGALASGLGYLLWYAVMPALAATTAASVQLSVPVLTALGGVVLLGEAVTWRLLLAAVAILGGIALTLRPRAAREALHPMPGPAKLG